MTDQTLALILIFVFAVIALLALGARAFTQLVELILQNGSKVEALMQGKLPARTPSSRARDASSSSQDKPGSHTTPE
jgi:hypothetical protein